MKFIAKRTNVCCRLDFPQGPDNMAAYIWLCRRKRIFLDHCGTTSKWEHVFTE